MNLLGFLVIGALAGAAAGQLTKGRGFGLLGDVIVGVIGSFVGGFLFGLLGLASYGAVGAFVTALAGAVVFLYLLGFLRARRV
jgi:uncharacterized membrane protein YeaQ/YmgE (transglycosylase-associated protein family)